jgi:hypothetical protein
LFVTPGFFVALAPNPGWRQARTLASCRFLRVLADAISIDCCVEKTCRKE